MKYQDLVIGLAGSGGDGVITARELLVNAAASEGLHSFMLKSFGPQIRGGESSCRVRMSDKQIHSHGDRVHVLGVFNWNDFKRFRGEMKMTDPVVIVQDSADKTPEDEIPVDTEITRIGRASCRERVYCEV